MAIVNNGVLIAIIAHGLIGISLVWDKVLLGKTQARDVVNYVFWLGAMSIFGVILVFFGFHLPSLTLIGLALGAGIIHLGANFFYYSALKRGEASQTLAIMGGLSPAATALVAVAFLDKPLGGASILGFGLMVGGGFFMFLSEKISWRQILPLALLAAATFGLTNVMQKMVFNQTNFVSGYVFFTMGTLAGSLLLLVRPSWRDEILQQSQTESPSNKFWYFVNRVMAGFGSFLIFFAISRANPAVVDAIAGVRYGVIFAGTFLLTRWKPQWLRETFSGWTVAAKSIATAAVIVGLIVIGVHGNQAGGGASAADAHPALHLQIAFREEREELLPGQSLQRRPIDASARLL